jgi:hypothetical protein
MEFRPAKTGPLTAPVQPFEKLLDGFGVEFLQPQAIVLNPVGGVKKLSF